MKHPVPMSRPPGHHRGRRPPGLLCLALALVAGALVAGATPALAAAPASQAAPADPPVLAALRAELDRSMEGLKTQPQPPYFLAYEVVDMMKAGVQASFGSIVSSRDEHDRVLRIDMRVGDYAFDSSHEMRDNPLAAYLERLSLVPMPIEDDPDALRSALWLQTDKAYKRALERFTKVQTEVKVKVDEEDKSADFSRQTAEVSIEEIPGFAVDRAAWERKLKQYTEPFTRDGRIYEARATFGATREIRWFVSSEGSRIQTPRVGYRLSIAAMTKADDGMELPLVETFSAFTPEGLPGDAVVLEAVQRMMQNLEALRAAPVVDPYTGPAILSGRASSVFFHEIFGHRVEGERQRREEEGQTFKKMVGQPVLPADFSVIFDPTIRRMADTDLSGSYNFDDEGVRGQRVVVVDHGVLKSFLMSRKPIEGFPGSNGHGRCQPGFTPVSRQSNLIVQVDKPVTDAQLKRMLIERVKKEGKPFGLVFDDIVGGFTMTGRSTPNAFNVTPVVVHRIYPDGREELVRGVDLIGTPLTSFSRIAAGSDQPAVFNGTCGAESGGVPVSCVSPAILVDQIEVQKKEKSQERPPLLNPPQRNSLSWLEDGPCAD